MGVVVCTTIGNQADPDSLTRDKRHQGGLGGETAALLRTRRSGSFFFFLPAAELSTDNGEESWSLKQKAEGI